MKKSIFIFFTFLSLHTYADCFGVLNVLHLEKVYISQPLQVSCDEDIKVQKKSAIQALEVWIDIQEHDTLSTLDKMSAAYNRTGSLDEANKAIEQMIATAKRRDEKIIMSPIDSFSEIIITNPEIEVNVCSEVFSAYFKVTEKNYKLILTGNDESGNKVSNDLSADLIKTLVVNERQLVRLQQVLVENYQEDAKITEGSVYFLGKGSSVSFALYVLRDVNGKISLLLKNLGGDGSIFYLGSDSACNQ